MFENLVQNGFTPHQALSIINRREVKLWLYIDKAAGLVTYFNSVAEARMSLPMSKWKELIPTITTFETI